MLKKCRKHGLTEHHIAVDRPFRCRKCNVEAVMQARRRRKQELVDLMGGKCLCCKYDRSYEALEFHHLDRSTKSFGLSTRGLYRSLAKAIAEAKLCVLVCSNCHREIEAGVRTVTDAMKARQRRIFERNLIRLSSVGRAFRC